MSALLVDALNYAARGWRVLPLHTPTDGVCSCGKAKCQSPGKHPRTAHGVKDGTTDVTQIKAWWKQWPNANVGIATGNESGLVVLDVDAGGEDSLHALEIEHEPLPDTPESHTGGGGRHLLFEHPGDGEIPNKVGLAPGLDVRGVGGYIVAPPSRHQSGQSYAWEAIHGPDDVPLAPWPAWLLNGHAHVANGKKPIEAVKREPILEGERNATLARLAGSYLGRGFAREETLTQLHADNARCVDRDGRPAPLAAGELDKIVTSIARAELLKRGETDGATRAEKLKVLSEHFGVEITDIIRISGSRPVYRFVNGQGAEMEIPARELAFENYWKRACVEQFNFMPKPAKPDKKAPPGTPGWRHYLNLMLGLARSIDAGEEATQLGQLKNWIRGYLRLNRPTPQDEKAITPQAPARDGKGNVHVAIGALLDHLRVFDVKISSTAMAQRLAGAGFERSRIHKTLKTPRPRVNSDRTTVSMWRVPTAFLPDANEAYEVPGVQL